MVRKVGDIYKKHLLALTIGPLIKMIEALFDLLIPMFMKAIIDLSQYNDPSLIPSTFSKALATFIRLFPTVNSNQILSDAIIGGIIILLMGVVGFLMTMITQYIAAKTAIKVGTEIRESLFEKVLSLSTKDKEEFGMGKIQTILNADSYQIQQGVLIFIRLIVRAPFIIVGALIISLMLNWKIGLVFASIIPLILFVVFFIMSKSSKKYTQIQGELENISTKSEDTIVGNKDIRVYQNQENELSGFKKITDSYQKKSNKANLLNSFINPLTFAIVSIAILLVVIIGGNTISSSTPNEATLLTSTIITEIAYLFQIFVTLGQLTSVILILTKANVSRRRANDLYRVIPSIKEDLNPLTLSVNKGEELLRFDNVSLSYGNNENYALKDISFSLKKGETLGIIGGTGSGKSSIVSLIERFMDPSKGNIIYKGNFLDKYKLSSLRDELSYVPQKSRLFKGTILENMQMVESSIQKKEVDVALKIAMAYDFVYQFEDNINHQLNEGGNNLSGGQRQRLCIARGIIKQKELLILDDSTSALDLLTDKRVRDNISSQFKDLTKIIISQRVSTIKDSDLIIVLDRGTIVAKGNHEELLKTSQIYKEIYDSQLKEANND